MTFSAGFPRIFRPAFGPGLSSGITPFDFNASLATFTAGMAKRTAPGPFAAAPIVQGKLIDTTAPDSLVYGRGTQVAGTFYQTLDDSSGSAVFWITPEWDGNDGKDHIVWSPSASSPQMFVLKTSSNNLVFYLDDSPLNSVSVSTSAWTAGTTYCVVVRWSKVATLDGTNYLSLSVNDSHSFGGTNAPDSHNPSSSPNAIGKWQTASIYGANAIIEGLTIYRRPLFDGAYGVDVGNGDELAAIYASGAGKDPTEVTGSWDVVFCLPTNSSTGALTTGTGEAWTHPHASAVLTDTFCQTTYASSAWSTKGSPTTGPADAATASKIFAWGYSFEASADGDGIQQSKTSLTAGQNYVIRLLAHSASNIRLRVYDDINAADITTVTFGSGSSKATPGVAKTTFTLPALCTAITISVEGTAAGQTVVVHQAELQLVSTSFSTSDFVGINSAGTLANAVLQVGSGTTAAGHEVARITATSPTLFDPVKLTAVSLTVTPASQANSTETSGLRVDGLDTLTQPITNLTATAGQIRFKWTPRHSAAGVVKFGNSAAYIVSLYGAADNYIRVYWSAANTITLAFNDGGGEHTTTWDATGAIAAGSTYAMQIDYSASVMTLSVGGVVKATITTAISFATVPTTAYWGSTSASISQIDATFAAPA